MALHWCLVSTVVISYATADYDCLCNNNVELAVHNEIRYVKTGPNTKMQMCPGDSPDSDRVFITTTSTTTVTTPTTTTTMTTKPVSFAPSTTTTVATTHPTTTTSSTTTSSTTNPPTTTTVATTQPTTTTSSKTSRTSPTSSTTNPPTTTTTQAGIISGNLNLCPVALQSFAARDGGILAQYDKSCYEVLPRRQTWTFAENDCKTKGGHLVDITSAAEQDFIFKFLQAKYPHNMWIGLQDIKTEGNYEWISGSPVSYTNWLSGRTTTYHNINDCVYLRPQNGGYWNEAECGTGPLFVPHAYLCQYDIDTHHGTANPIGDGDSHKCPNSVQQHASRYYGNLGQYKDSCYELLPRYKVTWSHGEQLCKQEGGHLVHIGDADEQNFVEEFMTRHMADHAVWTGLNDRQNETNFEWSSGQPVTYTNWAPGHVGNWHSHHVEDCALFIPYKSGLWDDVTCGQNSVFGDAGETHPILCEFHSSNSHVTDPSVVVIG